MSLKTRIFLLFEVIFQHLENKNSVSVRIYGSIKLVIGMALQIIKIWECKKIIVHLLRQIFLLLPQRFTNIIPLHLWTLWKKKKEVSQDPVFLTIFLRLTIERKWGKPLQFQTVFIFGKTIGKELSSANCCFQELQVVFEMHEYFRPPTFPTHWIWSHPPGIVGILQSWLLCMVRHQSPKHIYIYDGKSFTINNFYFF